MSSPVFCIVLLPVNCSVPFCYNCSSPDVCSECIPHYTLDNMTNECKRKSSTVFYTIVSKLHSIPFYWWHQNCSKLLAIRELLQPTSFYGFHSTHSLQLVKAVVSLSFWNYSLAVFISTLNEWQFQIVHQYHFKLIRLANTIRYSNEIDTLEPHLIFQQTAISPIAHYVMFLTNALRVRQVINNWRDCANVSTVLVFKLKYFLRLYNFIFLSKEFFKISFQ